MAGYKNQTTKLPPANFCCLLLLSVALCITGPCPFLFPFIDNKLGSFNKLAAMPALTDWPLSLEKLYTKTCYTEPQNLSHLLVSANIPAGSGEQALIRKQEPSEFSTNLY